MDKVYWIRNSECKDVKIDGYIGVSQNPERRFKQHLKKNERIPKDAWVEILFEGTRIECFALEEKLRPLKNTGWNRAVGGAQGFKKGFTHSGITREKLKAAWTPERKKIAAKKKAEQNRQLIGQKRPKQSDAIRGSKNPMYGKTHSPESKQLIADANRGRIATNRQELYCVCCHQRASQHVLLRHQKCWNNYKKP